MQNSSRRQRCIGSVALLLLFACGSTNHENSSATGGSASEGGSDSVSGGNSATGGTPPASGGSSAGTASSANTGGKANIGGTATTGGSANTGGLTSTGGKANIGGAATTGGSAGGEPSGLVDCDLRKVLCRIVTPTCSAGQVPSVNGTCYGPCVKIESCACSSAAECPNNDEYTCWGGKHCGPYVD
jgi:hypothetical protein